MSAHLSLEDKIAAFKSVTGGLHRYLPEGEDIAMTDMQLEVALSMELGIFGGSGGPGKMSITYQGAGLKIWAAWEVINHCTEKPILQGAATIKMAREVYGIRRPGDTQLSLF